jgi:hypothetical protein
MLETALSARDDNPSPVPSSVDAPPAPRRGRRRLDEAGGRTVSLPRGGGRSPGNGDESWAVGRGIA